eukprot:TRINITY_DN4034_c0_g1_i5.p1 TRINITY_DN4034_c0_g1~~TRINITY_DN4034_c0_g1_i5.p1  ORF type:complete len:157 (-),score=21.45 TRINITY_DN4034_c0_g1_i5:114-584(-)
MREIYNRFWGGDSWIADITGNVNNAPDTTGHCHDDGGAASVDFSFDLPQDFFQIPYDDSCKLGVWVTIDLWYRGVQRPDELLANTGKKLLEDDENQMFVFGESRSITLTQSILLTDLSILDDQPVVENVDNVDDSSTTRFAPFMWTLLLLAALILC